MTRSGSNRPVGAALAAAAAGLVVLAFCTTASAETWPLPTDPSADDVETVDERVETFNRRRFRLQRRAMATLGGWSALNIAVGTAGALTTDGTTRHFHLANASWNLVNAAIAALGYTRAHRSDPAEGGLLEALDAAHSTEKVLLFNAGLNVAYITAGAALYDRGVQTDSEQLKGWGPSVMLQGAFLLGFDTTVFLLSRSHRQQFQLDIAPLGPTGLSAILRF